MEYLPWIWSQLTVYIRFQFPPICYILVCISLFVSTGPNNWPTFFTIASGKRQSPVNILPDKVEYDSGLKPLRVSYPAFEKATLSNTGQSVLFAPDVNGENDSGEYFLYAGLMQHAVLYVCVSGSIDGIRQVSTGGKKYLWELSRLFGYINMSDFKKI